MWRIWYCHQGASTRLSDLASTSHVGLTVAVAVRSLSLDIIWLAHANSAESLFAGDFLGGLMDHQT